MLRSCNPFDNFLAKIIKGLGCFLFARRYWGNLIRFLFLRLLRCFSSPGMSPYQLWIRWQVSDYYIGRVTPFGNPRVKACLRLTEAYRCLPRPSSPHLT